jgi:hypothetical protein
MAVVSTGSSVVGLLTFGTLTSLFAKIGTPVHPNVARKVYGVDFQGSSHDVELRRAVCITGALCPPLRESGRPACDCARYAERILLQIQVNVFCSRAPCMLPGGNFAWSPNVRAS